MTPEKLFHELLGLGLNWEVKESRFEPASGTVFLEICETPISRTAKHPKYNYRNVFSALPFFLSMLVGLAPVVLCVFLLALRRSLIFWFSCFSWRKSNA